jgi:hypothetical protein
MIRKIVGWFIVSSLGLFIFSSLYIVGGWFAISMFFAVILLSMLLSFGIKLIVD